MDNPPSNVDMSKSSSGHYKSKSVMMYCQRCFSIQQYHRDTQMVVPGSRRVFEKDEENLKMYQAIERVLKRIPENAIVIKVVDVLDFEASLIPELFDALSNRKIPVLTVLNKMDCLPVERSRWTDIVKGITPLSKQVRSAIGSDGRVNIVPVSSASGDGFSEVEERLGLYMSAKDPRPVYVVGRENSGKSTFVTRFLRYIGSGQLGCVHYKREVGGITRSPIPGTTRAFLSVTLSRGSDITDTPGIPSVNRIQAHFRRSEDFYDVSSGKQLQPLTYNIKEGKTLFIGAMCRVELPAGSSVLVSCFVSARVTLHLCNSTNADDFLRRKAGTFLYPPHSDGSCEESHDIARATWVKHSIRIHAHPAVSRDDISIAGLGWIGIYGSGPKRVDIWVPEGVQVFRRPALIPGFIQKFGSVSFSFRHRARSLHLNKKKRALVASLRDKQHKDEWRSNTLRDESSHNSPPHTTESVASPLVDMSTLSAFKVHES